MGQQSKILEVKDLRISFRVDSGTVKAVRGISFDLYRGRTLCIVGESGSGKSVTSRAILGILAKNAIVDDGEIIYDGKDLLTINEDRFHKIRGSKISMIFQDPLSALNPIMRVGKQLTEPIFLKAKANKREAGNDVRDIQAVISKTSSDHHVVIDRGLLSRFVAAVLEEANYNDEKARYDRFVAVNARSQEIVDHAAEHPAKSVKAAKKNLARKPVLEPKDELTKALNDQDKAALHDLFKGLIEASYQDYVEALKNLTASAKEVEARIEQTSDYNELSKSFAEIGKVANACKFAFRDDEDDVIGVFATALKKRYQNLRMALKRELAQEQRAAKLQAKGQEEKPLTVKQRAKMPEKVLSSEEAKKVLVHLFTHLQHHIADILAKPLDFESYTDKFIAYYEDRIAVAQKKVSTEEAKETALDIMRQVGIPQPETRFYQYPFEFSGGMRQRIVIAIALSSRPEILICDEPTTALDVTIQGQILELIKRIQKERNLSCIFITHDLGVVANMADRVAVMYAGKIVEYGTAEEVFFCPRHPYTWALLSSIPDVDSKERLDAIPGTPPNMIYPPKGDAFAARSRYAMNIDFERQPPFFKISETHYAATWLLHPNAPKAEPPKIVTERIRNNLDASPRGAEIRARLFGETEGTIEPVPAPKGPKSPNPKTKTKKKGGE